MKRLLSLLLALVLLVGLAMPASAAKAKAAVMRLQLSDGGVSIQDAAGKSVAYQKDMRLYSGYTVSTDSRGSAYILLDETKAVKLDRDTTVNIKKSGRKLQVKLKCGQLFFNVTAPLQSDETLEIRTSSMVVGVRGSSGIVNLREVIFTTGHGVVYSGGTCFEIAGGQAFRPKDGVFPAGIALLPSLFLKEARDNEALRDRIRGEGHYSVDQLIAAIPSAEAREAQEFGTASAAVNAPPETENTIPAFGQEPAIIEPLSFTITWMDGDHVLKTEEIEEGSIPAWAGETPAKAADAQYTYSFAGWTPEITAVSGDAVYTASYTATLRQYTVTWRNDDGSVIDTVSVPYGETPTHDDPVKAATPKASYTFTGWDKPVVPVTGDADYTAVFTATLRQYTVTWRNDDGSVIDTVSVPYGETPTHDDPVKAATPKASYTFTGWDKPVVPVTGDADYTAVFEATYDFTAIIPQSTDNLPYQLFFPTEGNTPITTAKEGEEFTFYLGGTGGQIYTVLLNGEALNEDQVYYRKDMDAVVCTFIVPADPVIEIEPD